MHCQWNSTWLHPATPLTDKYSFMLNQHSFKQLSLSYSVSEKRGKLGLAQQQSCSNASFLGRQASLEVRKLQFHSESTGCICALWCETWEICELFIHASFPPDSSPSSYSSQSREWFFRLTHSGFSQSAFKCLINGGFITSNHMWTSLTKYYIGTTKPESILIAMDT